MPHTDSQVGAACSDTTAKGLDIAITLLISALSSPNREGISTDFRFYTGVAMNGSWVKC